VFKICLFDLDQTLLWTDDLKEIREAGKRVDSPEYRAALTQAFTQKSDRQIYSEALLVQIRAQFPELKVVVFTRSPRSYASVVLQLAYPNFGWDLVVAYEDVQHTKPYGDGIDVAMQKFKITMLDQVLLVGDSDSDVRSAYHAGCMVTLDKGKWPDKRGNEHWNALGHIPDAIIAKPEELVDVLANANGFLPELERLLVDAPREGAPRFERINHFIPRSIGGTTTPFPIYVAGRSFAGYESLKWRRKWHLLTSAIKEQKDADVFPEEWVEAVFTFINTELPFVKFAGNLTITAIPHRPGRKPRLQTFVSQLAASELASKFRKNALSFAPDLLAYKDGVRSNSNDHLGRDERFVNVRDHLFVQRPELVTSQVLVLDDVTTTGSTLIYAKKYLELAGARSVTCLSLAKNISDVL
jgi:phosphoglycolate phosphatase-like HAD superfamily hydrolase